ncbi:hypothetical protein [Endozoicomonas sp. Mp262]|uniref:hypothetical protein n=1 Tax=Endozoicomonas sp. Mp262 TaxID=2919499 RepID=UPI0021D9CBA6
MGLGISNMFTGQSAGMKAAMTAGGLAGAAAGGSVAPEAASYGLGYMLGKGLAGRAITKVCTTFLAPQIIFAGQTAGFFSCAGLVWGAEKLRNRACVEYKNYQYNKLQITNSLEFPGWEEVERKDTLKNQYKNVPEVAERKVDIDFPPEDAEPPAKDISFSQKGGFSGSGIASWWKKGSQMVKMLQV